MEQQAFAIVEAVATMARSWNFYNCAGRKFTHRPAAVVVVVGLHPLTCRAQGFVELRRGMYGLSREGDVDSSQKVGYYSHEKHPEPKETRESVQERNEDVEAAATAGHPERD